MAGGAEADSRQHGPPFPLPASSPSRATNPVGALVLFEPTGRAEGSRFRLTLRSVLIRSSPCGVRSCPRGPGRIVGSVAGWRWAWCGKAGRG